MEWVNLLDTPVIAAIVGFAVWFVQSRIERIRRERDRLHDDRRQIYSDVLEPYIRMFAGIGNPHEQKQVVKQITSFEYRKKAFDFSLLGSDDVVRAFNDMMQYFFRLQRQGQEPKAAEMLERWGAFLLAIRKDVGNPKTNLTHIDMLRGQITDIDRIVEE